MAKRVYIMTGKEVLIVVLLVVGTICTINLVVDMIFKYLFKKRN